MKTALKLAGLAFAIPAILAFSALAGTNARRSWSVDVTKYIGPENRLASKAHPYSDVYLATTNSHVGAALEVGDPTSGPWKSSLLVFDANNGKLYQKCGPWNDRTISALWATANGNFLLIWEQFPETGGMGTNISLLSPSCAELKKLALPASKDKRQRAWNALLSPSERTLLTVETESATTTFTIRDADTLAALSVWQQPRSDAMTMASVSDKGLLALKYLKRTDDFSPAKLFYRSFDSTSWRDLTDTLTSSNQDVTARFLSNDNFMESADVGEMNFCNATEAKIEVRRVSGQLVSSATISKNARAVDFPLVGNLRSSADGRFFGTLLRFTNIGWFWCNFDMRSEHYYAYIWSSSTMQLAARIRLNIALPQLPLAIAPSGTWLAIENGNDLTVRALEPPKETLRR